MTLIETSDMVTLDTTVTADTSSASAANDKKFLIVTPGGTGM